MPITVKARDGKTDLYGLMYVPTNLDSTKKYPIINHIYPGPQTGSVGGRSFNAARGDAQALAELGFVVVEIDGMGTPWRSKAFHDAYYGNMGDNTLPDQIAGMKELAARYKWIDIDRAGDLRPLRRRLRHGRRDVPLSGFLQGRNFGIGQPRQPRVRGRLGRAISGPRDPRRQRRLELRRPGESEPREESQGQAAARARHDGRQRAAATTRCSSSTR